VQAAIGAGHDIPLQEIAIHPGAVDAVVKGIERFALAAGIVRHHVEDHRAGQAVFGQSGLRRGKEVIGRLRRVVERNRNSLARGHNSPPANSQ
jgi:hypothetical protein